MTKLELVQEFRTAEARLLKKLTHVIDEEVTTFLASNNHFIACRYSHKKEKFIELSWISSDGINYIKL